MLVVVIEYDGSFKVRKKEERCRGVGRSGRGVEMSRVMVRKEGGRRRERKVFKYSSVSL